jgi:hypothetical protein
MFAVSMAPFIRGLLWQRLIDEKKKKDQKSLDSVPVQNYGFVFLGVSSKTIFVQKLF